MRSRLIAATSSSKVSINFWNLTSLEDLFEDVALVSENITPPAGPGGVPIVVGISKCAIISTIIFAPIIAGCRYCGRGLILLAIPSIPFITCFTALIFLNKLSRTSGGGHSSYNRFRFFIIIF